MFSEYVGSYNTRLASREILNVIRVNTIHSAQSILYRGPTLFNSIPRDIKIKPNINPFKFHLKRHLLSKY